MNKKVNGKAIAFKKYGEGNMVVLNPEAISFLKYFIHSYHKSFNKGLINESHHDAAAIVLFLTDILVDEEFQ
jgi:hypothetical protein